MASIAANTARKTRASRPPLLVHPAFPAVVALWFAALLGLGSLILPDALFNTGVEATGIASVIPAAAPPLGGFARTIIALVAALIGAGLGLIITRQIAKSLNDEPSAAKTVQDDKPTTRKRGLFSGKDADDAVRPINAHEELGQEGFGRSEEDSSSIDEDTSYIPSAPTPVAIPVTIATSVAGAAIAAALVQDEDVAPADDLAVEEDELENEAPMDETPMEETEPEEAELDSGEDETNEETEDKLSEAAQCLAMAKTGEQTDAPDWQHGPLKDLSLLHLTQRLATSFEARRQWRAAQGKPAVNHKMAASSGMEAALEADAESARAAFFNSSDDETPISGQDAPANEPVSIGLPPEDKALKTEANQDALRDALKKLQGLSGAA